MTLFFPGKLDAREIQTANVYWIEAEFIMSDSFETRLYCTLTRQECGVSDHPNCARCPGCVRWTPGSYVCLRCSSDCWVWRLLPVIFGAPLRVAQPVTDVEQVVRKVWITRQLNIWLLIEVYEKVSWNHIRRPIGLLGLQQDRVKDIDDIEAIRDRLPTRCHIFRTVFCFKKLQDVVSDNGPSKKSRINL